MNGQIGKGVAYYRNRRGQGSDAEEAKDHEGLGMVSRVSYNGDWEGERYLNREHDDEGSQEQIDTIN